jgi:pantoate--beta-alanine ligase
MGYLHDGHVSLMRYARKQSDIVIVSIFVNPLQFGPNEDYKKYPRDIARDEEIVKQEGVDVLFYPDSKDMYPEGYSTYVEVTNITDNLCGASRPNHFKGVTTVVTKLFEITKPDIAYFGQKDAQQVAVIKKMVGDLNMDILIKVMPIVRESDGLAMSSRNVYLTKDERSDALAVNQALKKAEELYLNGERESKKIIEAMKDIIRKKDTARIDYLKIVDLETLKDIDRISDKALAAAAILIGKTRLIDNVVLGEKNGKI